MFNGPKEGSRGGKEKFSWDDVKNDRQRMNYLGNSVKVPDNRHKDLFWYAKKDKGASDLEKELREQKEREAKMTGFYLERGFGAKLPEEPPTTTTENAVAREQRRKLRDERRALKEERKRAREAKRLAKEAKKQAREDKKNTV
jgi:hypothetical protein